MKCELLKPDAHGRRETITDARAGTTSFVYNDADQVVSVISPAPEPGLDPQVTSNDYDSMGRLWKTTFPDGASVTNEFFPTGLISKKSGAREYPAAFAYDAQGRMTGMTTQPDDPARAAVTTWNYDPFRGSLASKLYEGNVPGPIYTNTAAGKLSFRGWARGTNTSYAYNRLGDLATVAYNDGSPSVTSGYDRRGRLISTTRGSEVIRRSFDDAGNLLGETYSGGPLNGLTVTNMYDQLLRRTSVALLNASGTVLAGASYGYDAASRLRTVANGANIAAYNYVANSDLIDRVSLTNSGALRMTTSRTYDFLNRLTSVSSVSSASSVVSFSYSYNAANQRTSVTMADGSSWAFGYDDLGQVTSGARRWSDGSEVVGQQFGYNFDQIGNRLFTLSGGHTAAYSNNSLNQITSREVPGWVSILGEANSNATVTLWADNGAWAYTSRHGDYFAGELPVTNNVAPVWLTITNLAVLQDGNNPDFISTEIGHALLPATPEQFQYDPDGNLISDGTWSYTWDAENRLVAMTNAASLPDAARKALVFTYDYSGRRTQKDVFLWNPSTLSYELSTRSKFVYDGWNLLAVLDGDNAPLISFTWGMDLSGTMQGAGGVGGLISMTVHSGANVGTYFYVFDGNGNVVALVNSSDCSVVARYEYGPFGELLRATGLMAKVNPFRFSTKFQDNETDLLYYGYRYYISSTGRWLSRDPLGEEAGEHVYRFVWNTPTGFLDPSGLSPIASLGPNAGILLNGPRPVHALFDPSSEDAFDLFPSWVTGTTADSVSFKDGDPMAEQMKNSPEVRSAALEFVYALELQGKCGEKLAFVNVSRSLDRFTWYQHLGYAFNPLYSESIWWDMYHNPARAFLGSFNGRADLIYVDCCRGRARMEVRLRDRPRLGSATHTPLNYAGGLPDVSGPVGTPFRTFRIDMVFHLDFNFFPRGLKGCDCEHFYLPSNTPLF